jgi:hypothetical protein
MNKTLAVTLLVSGIMLLGLGIRASSSFSGDLARLFIGAPTDRAIWMVVGGALTAATGLLFALGAIKNG